MPSFVTTVNSGSNTASTIWAISTAAYNSGDLVLLGLASDDTVTHGTLPSGFNGESAQTVVNSFGNNLQRISVWYWVATANQVASSVIVTPSATEQRQANCSIVAAGDFDSAQVIGEISSRAQNIDIGAVSTFGFTAGASDGGGLLCAWIGVDTDPITGTPSGWSSIASVDIGAVSGTLSQRTSSVGNSESIPVYIWTIASDTWANTAFIIRPATGGAPVQMFTMFPPRLDGIGRGGIFPGNRLEAPMMRLAYKVL